MMPRTRLGIVAAMCSALAPPMDVASRTNGPSTNCPTASERHDGAQRGEPLFTQPLFTHLAHARGREPAPVGEASGSVKQESEVEHGGDFVGAVGQPRGRLAHRALREVGGAVTRLTASESRA